MVWATPVPQRFTASARGRETAVPRRREGGHGKADGEALEGVQPHQERRRQNRLPGEKAAMASAVN